MFDKIIRATNQWLICFFCLLLCAPAIAMAGEQSGAQADSSKDLYALIANAKKRLIVQKTRSVQLTAKLNIKSYAELQHQANIDQMYAEFAVKKRKIALSLLAQRAHDIEFKRQTLLKYDHPEPDDTHKSVPESLLELVKEQKVLESRSELVQELLNIEEAILQVQKEWSVRLAKFAATKDTSTLQAQRLTQEQQFLDQRNKIVAALDKLHKDLAKLDPSQLSDIEQLNDQIAEKEDNLQLIDLKVSLLSVRENMQKLEQLLSDKQRGLFSIRISREIADEIDHALEKYGAIVQENLTLLRHRLQILQDSFQDKILKFLTYKSRKSHLQAQQDEYQKLLKVINDEQSTVKKQQALIANAFGKGLSVHYPLPLTAGQWKTLFRDVGRIPKLTVLRVKEEFYQLFSGLHALHGFWLVLSFVVQIVWFAICIVIFKSLSELRRRSQASERTANNENAVNQEGADIKQPTFLGATVMIVADLVGRKPLSFAVFTLVFALIFIRLLLGHEMSILILVGLLWLLVSFAIIIAKVVLLENTVNIQGRDVRLYYPLKWSFVVSGIVAIFAMLAHHLQSPIDVVAFFDRFFMFMLLVISYPLLRGWAVIPDLFLPFLGRRTYLRRLLRFVGFLLPLTLFSNAALGTLGYVNLAWRIGVIEGQFILTICAWILIRGILGDFMQRLSEFFIRKISNGWLWTRALLKPLHHLLNFSLVIAMLFVFAMLFSPEPIVLMQKTYSIINQPLFVIAKRAVTLLDLFLVFVSLAIMLWAAKWSHEFAYRWLFNRARDSGLRNSLAAFTQYTVIFVGVFVILHFLGIDLTTLTLIAGVFAIGIAFGVRDIVNNLLSGFMLLIERPIRKGDYIQVGEEEGEVIHLGARAITIRTPLNKDLIVPNAQPMMTTFTNFTRHDSIICDLIEITVNFKESPERVKEVIMKVLQENPSVLESPSCSILLKAMHDGHMEFEVCYHIDLQENKLHTHVKSALLFAIWRALSQAGIPIAHPVHDVHLERADWQGIG